MKPLLRVTLTLAALCATAVGPVAAGELQLTIANGRATLIAQDVPVRQILAEWSRLGQTRIVNGEKLVGPPVTLHLVDKPEREVLEAVLRSASGYVAAPRTATAAGASVYETVMIMPTSRPPAVTASAPPAFNRTGFPQPQPQPQPQPMMPVEEDRDDVEVADQGPVPPPGTIPPGAVISPQPGFAPQQVQPYPGMMQQPPGMQPMPQPPMTAPRPGVVSPQQPQVPGNPYQPQPQPVRPPGGPGSEL